MTTRADEFYRYGWCPRGSGDLEAHREKDLHHVWIEGRLSCMAGEMFHKMREARVPMGYFPRERLPLQRRPYLRA